MSVAARRPRTPPDPPPRPQDEQTAAPNLKILEAAYRWKRQRTEVEPEDGGGGSGGGGKEGGSGGEDGAAD
jgi:hypothetical protein